VFHKQNQDLFIFYNHVRVKHT